MVKSRKRRDDENLGVKGLEKQELEDLHQLQKISSGQIQKSGIPEKHVEVERYPLSPPFAYAVITQNTENLEYLYVTDELPLTPKERRAYDRLRDILEYELQPTEDNEDPRRSFHRQLPKIVASHQDELKGISNLESKKIMYYATRDILGFERAGPLMDDP
ncbi:MAG: hypothetical protein ACE5KU_05285, partial [Nitrososphaerales archaeon]